MRWSITWSISSYFNSSTLIISSYLCSIIWILRIVLSWWIFYRLRFIVLLRFLIIGFYRILRLVLISYNSIRYSRFSRIFLNILLSTLGRLIYNLIYRIRILIYNFWSILLSWYIYLLDSLNIGVLRIIITIIILRLYLFPITKEIILLTRLVLCITLIFLNLFRLFTIPININTLLDYVIFSTLTIIINKFFNIPS